MVEETYKLSMHVYVSIIGRQMKYIQDIYNPFFDKDWSKQLLERLYLCFILSDSESLLFDFFLTDNRLVGTLMQHPLSRSGWFFGSLSPLKLCGVNANALANELFPPCSSLASSVCRA